MLVKVANVYAAPEVHSIRSCEYGSVLPLKMVNEHKYFICMG